MTKRQSERKAPRGRWLMLGGWSTAVAVVLLGVGAASAAIQARAGTQRSSTGLPRTSDYHSLLVSPTNPRALVLGTHQGLYRSNDGGRTWEFALLSGSDAMNLVRPGGQTVWLAGHTVFKKSVDGGLGWEDVRPTGLPSLDIHGFTVNPSHPGTLYAAIAGEGLYRSANGGRSFNRVSSEVGGNVMALAVTAQGRILAGDLQRGLLESRNGGKTWRVAWRAPLLGLAINPRLPQRLLATGRGIARSLDGGRTWKIVLDLPVGSGPVAWSASNPNLAYVVGFDRVLYRSADGGRSWRAVR